MSRVLWITPVPPDHRGGGGHMRQAYLLDALSERADVELVVVREPLRDDEVRRRMASVTEVPIPTTEPRGFGRQVHHLREALFERYPREASALRPAYGRLAEILAARADHVDVVSVDLAGLAPILPEHRGSARYVLTFHNIVSGMARQSEAVAPTARRRWLYEREHAKARRLERWAVEHYDLVIAMSDVDAATLGDGVAVVPNGVDTQRFRPTPIPNTNTIVLTGALYTPANVDSAEWMCRTILPLVRAEVPDATLDLVGLAPAASVVALGDLPGVRLHADVASVTPFVEAARVCVCPIRIGTGTRLKALEALAAGRPLVGTTIGLEGLDLVDGEHVLVADEAEDFAAAVVRTLRDDALVAGLVGSGRPFVESRYSWSTIGERFVDLVLDGPNPEKGENSRATH